MSNDKRMMQKRGYCGSVYRTMIGGRARCARKIRHNGPCGPQFLDNAPPDTANPDTATISASCRVPPAAPPPYETVNHPKHYNLHPAGIECIDVIEHFSANLAMAMKYLWRAGLKPGVDADEDLKKAMWYTDRERTRLATMKARARLQEELVAEAEVRVKR